jgi:hypothetical protein
MFNPFNPTMGAVLASKLEREARRLVADAEAALGPLTDGMKRDLLKDNLTVSAEQARLIVEGLHGNS